jgi:hypothetical protein
MTNRFDFDLDPREVRWAANGRVSDRIWRGQMK